ncbi:hypothetical protein KRX57_05800 [Weeksellaceae bacterium TAE3-ERU29]|nr:hypothetical protein [Weeksellaceae bacterium TAE3-ERU29]
MKNKSYISFSLILLVLCFSTQISCRKDFNTVSNITNIQFSNDTVVFDTVMSHSNSETYLIRLYNNSEEDINIPNIYLNKKNNSYYRINVDGIPGFEFSDVYLRAKDSLNIFINIAAEDASDLIYEDEIILKNNNNQKSIKLLSFIAKAKYYYPKKGEDSFTIDKDTEFNNSSYHIIYGDFKVAENRKLNILNGTKVLFYKNGKITVSPNAQLNIIGTQQKPVIFKSLRNDVRHDSLPNQWIGITGLKNSEINLNHTEIKGAKTALDLTENKNKIFNTKIYNSGESAIFTDNSNILANNLVVNNAGNTGINITNGGNYKFYFSSIINNWQGNIVGIYGINLPFSVTNYSLKDDLEERSNLNLIIENSILYGRYPNGISIDLKDGMTNHIIVNHSLIKNESKKELDLTLPYFNNIITENPLLQNTTFGNPNLNPKENSPVIKKGNSLLNNSYPKNINGKERTTPPNIGAY